MHIDWYASTIYDKQRNIKEVLSRELNGVFCKERTGLNSYENRETMFSIGEGKGSKCLTLLYGGVNDHPHAFASGDNAEIFSNVVREVWGDSHHVTRIDSCEDLQGETVFDELSEQLLSVAKDSRIKISQQGDWIMEKSGRTLYLGSTTSPCRVRLYEKTEELRAKLPASYHSIIPENLVRLEIQARPQKNQRKEASLLSAIDVWGLSKWTSTVADKCLSSKVKRVKLDSWFHTNDDKSLDWMCRQYGSVILRLFRKHDGDHKAFCEDIFKKINNFKYHNFIN